MRIRKYCTHLNFHAVNRLMAMHQMNDCSLHLRIETACASWAFSLSSRFKCSFFGLILLLLFSMELRICCWCCCWLACVLLFYGKRSAFLNQNPRLTITYVVVEFKDTPLHQFAIRCALQLMHLTHNRKFVITFSLSIEVELNSIFVSFSLFFELMKKRNNHSISFSMKSI